MSIHDYSASQRRAEVESLLATDETMLGRVRQYSAENLSPKRMADREGLANSGFVSNYRSLIAVLGDGQIPSSPSLAQAGARRIRAWLKEKELSAALRAALIDQESVLASRANDSRAQAEEMAGAVRASQQAETAGTPGIYVCTLPHYIKYPVDLHTGKTLLKVGHSSSDAYYRAGSQGRLTALPEDLVLLRIYPVAACSGRLSADWREAHSGTQSVERALTSRPASNSRRRSKERAVDLELPDLPESYVLGTVGAAAVLLEYGTSKRCDAPADTGIPVLRMGNIQDWNLDFQDLKYCLPDGEINRLMLEDGDLLFNRTNSPELVGKSAVFHGQAPMSFASYLIRVRFAADVALPDFVAYWINSAWGRAWARSAKTDGVSESNISGSKLALMPLPLPPIEEQLVIFEGVSQLLSAADRILTSIAKAEKRVERSSQAVLAKAFRGELITYSMTGSEQFGGI